METYTCHDCEFVHEDAPSEGPYETVAKLLTAEPPRSPKHTGVRNQVHCADCWHLDGTDPCDERCSFWKGVSV